MKKEWNKDKDQGRQIKLPEDDVECVNHYLHFLYIGSIASQAGEPNTTQDKQDHIDECILLAKLYVLGEKFQDSYFKNALVDAIIAKAIPSNYHSYWYLTGESVNIIYEGTTSGSLARKLVVDMHAAYGKNHWLGKSGLNTDFLIDLTNRFFDTRDRELVIEEFENVNYHEHEDGAVCSCTETEKSRAKAAERIRHIRSGGM